MATTLEIIKQLREETGAGILDCRMALEQAGADYTQALEALRAKALLAATKRADHQASQGRIEVYSHGGGRIGVMVEVNTETDFAGRSAAFAALAHEIALQIAAAAPLYVRDEDIPANVLDEEAEKVTAKACRDGKPEALIPRIVAGCLDKYKNRTVLVRQAYIRDETITVGQFLARAGASLGEKISVRRFERWELDPESDGEREVRLPA